MKLRTLILTVLFVVWFVSATSAGLEKISQGGLLGINSVDDLLWKTGNRINFRRHGQKFVYSIQGYTALLNNLGEFAYSDDYPAKNVHFYTTDNIIKTVASGETLYLLGINDGFVLYSDGANIFLWNKETEDVRQIGDNTYLIFSSEVSLGNDRVAYEKRVYTTYFFSATIMEYTISTGAIRQVSDLPGKNIYPVINGQYLYWLNEQEGQKNLICWEGGNTKPPGVSVDYLRKERISPSSGKIGLLVSQLYPDDTVRLMEFDPASSGGDWTEILKMDSCLYNDGPVWKGDSTLIWSDLNGIYKISVNQTTPVFHCMFSKWSWSPAEGGRKIAWTTAIGNDTFVYCWQPDITPALSLLLD
jgi:hypothetical protein